MNGLRQAIHTHRDETSVGSKDNDVATLSASFALGLVFMSATIPTPLYPIYQKAFGFSSLTLTLVYAVYALGNLAVLIVFGGLADRIGRRRTVLAAVVLTLASTAAFAAATSVIWLFVGRFLSGLGTALVAGAATAWITDAEGHQVASRIATTANFAGLALGAVLAGTLAEVAPGLLVASYIVYLFILVGLGLAVVRGPDRTEQQPISLENVWQRPRIGVPREILRPFLSYAATGFAVFALVGFYAALIPSLLAQRLAVASPLVAGVLVLELFAAAAAAVLVSAKLENRIAAQASLALLVFGLCLLVGADLLRSMPLLALATFVGGVGAALGYRGSLALVNAIAPEERRTEVLSSYLIAVYCGNSLPVIGVGILSALTSATTAHIMFGVVISLLAVFAYLESRGLAYQGDARPNGKTGT